MFFAFRWVALSLALGWLMGKMGLRGMKWTGAILGFLITRSPVGAVAGLFAGWLLEGVFQRPKVHFYYERRTFDPYDMPGDQPMPGQIPPTVLSAYQTLGISPEASDDEVRQAYRRMAMKYHPDRVATQGEETRSRAERLFKAVGEAKERIFRYRGIK